MLRRPLVVTAVAASLALSAAAPSGASADATAEATSASAATHCYIFRPSPGPLLDYAMCRINEIIATDG